MLLMQSQMVTPYSSDDLLPISRIMGPVLSISVKSDAPWNSFSDLIKYAKENPGMKVGIQGVYNGAWLLLASINKAERTNFMSAPFGGGSEIISALLGGHVPIGTAEYSRVRPLREANKLKTLTTLAIKRPNFASDIPTAVELGYRLPERTYIALAGPKGMPDEIVKKLDSITQMITEDPAFQEKCGEMSIQIDYENNTTFKRTLKEETEHLKTILKEVGITKK
jgi:tripartite-type tricarboxylate transporter receptor subunit TctC